jgi:hypothetical protein
VALLVIKSSELLAVGDGPAKLIAAQLATAVPTNPGWGPAPGTAPRDEGWTTGSRSSWTAGCAREGPGWLLVRRRRDGELAVSACFGLAVTSLVGLVRVAGTR